MSNSEWRNGAGRLGHACSSRGVDGAHLWTQRVKGAVKNNIRMAWEWSVTKGDYFHDGPSVRTSGSAESEAEARAAADAALPAVLRAFDALTSKPR